MRESIEISKIPFPPTEDLVRTPPSVLQWFGAHTFVLEERIRELEEKLNMNSSNSSLPPSTDSPFTKENSLPAKKKERKKRAGARQQMLDPTEIRHCEPILCNCGGMDFLHCQQYHCHQHIEIPKPSLLVTHFLLYKGECATCGKTVKAHTPHEFATGYGVRLHALIGEFTGVAGMSRETVQSLLQSMYGLNISAGGLQKCLDRISKALVPHYEAIRKAVHETQVNYVDETTWRRFGPQGRSLHWLWLMTTLDTAYFLLSPRRDKVTFQKLIGDWKGVIVSDGYGTYKKWDGEARQTCLAHLLRDAKKLEENALECIASGGKQIKKELVRLCRMAHILSTRDEFAALKMRLGRFIKRNASLKNTLGKFARRLQREFSHLTTFRRYKDVGPTNNHAERTLRHAVVWRKRCLGSTSEKGERFVERILSVRQTCKLRAISTYDVLVTAMTDFAKGIISSTNWLNPT